MTCLYEIPVLGRLGDDIRDLTARGPQQEHLHRVQVEHVEERLQTHARIALKEIRTN